MSPKNPRIPHIVWHPSQVSSGRRSSLLKQRPKTFWLTGLSGAGKSTLAFALEKALLEQGRLAYTLDGDNVRHGLCQDLGFTCEDRAENIRRIAEVSHLMNDAGLIVVSAFISPHRKDREIARSIIGDENFLEIYVSTPMEICEQRDPKGLYRLAREGMIPEFTGVCVPYEEPNAPTLRLDTQNLSINECILLMLSLDTD